MSDWAVILGASSGFGAATAIELAKSGFNIAGVHLDRRATQPQVQQVLEQVQATGIKVEFFNLNAAKAETRRKVVARLQEHLGDTGRVKVLLHSLAFGVLKPVITANPQEALDQPEVELTLNVMAGSLLYWTQDLYAAGLLKKGSQIFAMTSSGGHSQWPNYGAVSGAKAALESYIRQLAVELAPAGIAANTIQAGVTDTPALRKIPGNEAMI
ncbi:MAG: SDR family oxidoreductase, partial [Candidatus Neomarinimicrobiota bacterium]